MSHVSPRLVAVALSVGLLACAISPLLAQDAGSVGVVGHIKVLSDKCEDISTPEAWKATYIKDGMSDQDKAIAIWKTVVKYRHQDNPPGEGLEGSKGNGNVHEPFKTFHVYGYGMCCCAAADIEGLARYIGMPARGRIINNHSVPEVWYNGSWHLLDASLMFFVQKPGADGKPATGDIASVDEMKQSIAQWKKDHPEVEIKNDTDWKNFGKNEGWKKGPALFATANDSPTGAKYQFYDKDGINHAGWHGWWSNMGEYNYKIVGEGRKIITPPDTVGEVNTYDYGAIMGYQLNVSLREGEKLTRCWYAKDSATGLNRRNVRGYEKFLDGDMSALGLQKMLGDLSPGRVGNGVQEYDALADSKLAQTAIAFENLKLDGGKLVMADASKPATLIVRMPSSYLYLGGEMAINPGMTNAGSVKASISLNNGLDWAAVGTYQQAGEQKADLKPHIFNKYDYRVKLELDKGAVIAGLKFTNTIQHSQAPLPLITEGENKITFSADKQAEGTITVHGNMEGKPEGEGPRALWIGDFHPQLDGAEMQRFAIGTTRDHDAHAGDPGNVIDNQVEPNVNHGSAIVPVTTPGDITRVRIGAHWRARNAADGFIITGSFDGGKSWKEIGKLELANPAKSTYIVFDAVPAGSKAVQIKFDGSQKNATEIFDLRIDVDYKEPAGAFKPVKVTYTWEEGVPTSVPAPPKGKKPTTVEKPHGEVKTAEHVCNTPTDAWTVKCGPGTVAKSFTIELAK